MSHLPSFTAQDLVAVIRKFGWHECDGSGSHMQFTHNELPGKVTIANHSKHAIPVGTVKSIFTQAGLQAVYKMLQQGTPLKAIERKMSQPQPDLT